LHIEFEVVEVVNEVHDGVDTGQCSWANNSDTDDDCMQLMVPAMHTVCDSDSGNDDDKQNCSTCWWMRHSTGRGANRSLCGKNYHVFCSMVNIFWWSWLSVGLGWGGGGAASGNAGTSVKTHLSGSSKKSEFLKPFQTFQNVPILSTSKIIYLKISMFWTRILQ
jgi:hypothetical protein